MNGPKKGISLTTPGFPLDEAPKEPNQIGVSLGLSLDDPKTFQTRKAEAMRKKGLNLKGNPLGTSLNSLAIRVKVRKAQALKNGLKNGLKNDQKNGQKNTKKNNPKKKTLKDRKMEEMKAILKKAKQTREHDKALRELRKMEPVDPKAILEQEKKKEKEKKKIQQEKIEKEYKNEHNFDKMFEGLHENQHMNMEGLDPAIAQQLERASHKAVLSDAKAQKALLKDPKPKSKSNNNIPDYRDEMDEAVPVRRIATNNVTQITKK
jgi:hypothetical protein